MKKQFIENGENILLRLSDNDSCIEVKLNHEEFFMLIRDGSRIVKNRLQHHVFHSNEIERILENIKDAKGRED